MLPSGRCYQPEMSEVVELLKAWKEEREEQARRLEQQREQLRIEQEEEKRHYERRLEQQQQQFEQLIQGLAERGPCCVEIGKLTRLMESDDIEAFLTTFEKAVELMGWIEISVPLFWHIS